jgi:rod shape-determining protein MreD
MDGGLVSGGGDRGSRGKSALNLPLKMPLPIAISLLLGLVLAILPLPQALSPLRPEWVLLILVYWGTAFPRRVGILTAAGMGLCLDILGQQLLGQNAVTLAIVAFIVSQIYPRLRVFPIWQQSMVVGFLVLLTRSIDLWIRGASGFPPETLVFWLPILSSALLWPLVYHVLRATRRRWLLHLT